MPKRLLILLLCVGTSAFAADPVDPAAAVGSADPCSAIRARIAAQSGILAQPDSALLKEIGSHQECAFSRAEVYRAGFGERPPAPVTHRRYQRRHDDDDD